MRPGRNPACVEALVPGRFAYIKLHHHPISSRIGQMLRDAFPDLQMDLIDVDTLVRSHGLIVLRNVLAVLREYGWQILLGRKRFRECFWRTPYIFRAMGALVAARLARGNYEFSLQNQSMFDGSTRGLPHFVYTDHTHLANLRYPGYDFRSLYSSKWVRLERAIYHNATLNFTRNGHTLRSIVEDYGCPPERVVSVYAGSNVRTEVSINEAKYHSKNILFVGLEWERKGGPELVEAFRRVLQAQPAARLTIVGCSPELDVPNCEVVGRVPLESLARYYEGACLLCLPSKLEPYAIVLLEAFAHALPAVTTDYGYGHDYVSDGENGYLVRLGDIDRLSEALIDLIDNPDRCRSFGENGRRLVLERFNWESVGADIARRIVAALADPGEGSPAG